MHSKASHGQQLSLFGGGAQEGNLCLDCGTDISHKRRDAQRCEPCANIRDRKRAKDFYRENRARVLQLAKNRQQTPEYKRLRQEWEERNQERIQVYRQRHKQKYREKTGYDPAGRRCADCHADISHRGHNAKKCVPCSTPPARTCKACDIGISHRGARAVFCSEQCKEQDQRSKELEGYTKACTKCSETKEHTEFRLHYKRRASNCKSCEANATREYQQALPVEERRRRRRIHGQREREKEANLPPEQKASLTAKRRQAHRRRRYGTDFDEDSLYSEQQGKCALCGTPKPLEDLELDHDHETGIPRGFLCKNCNFKLLPRYEKKFPRHHQDSPHLNAYLALGKRQ